MSLLLESYVIIIITRLLKDSGSVAAWRGLWTRGARWLLGPLVIDGQQTSPGPTAMSPPATSRSDHQNLGIEEEPHLKPLLPNSCQVPDLMEVTRLPCYWGALTQRQAEDLLRGCPDGSFLLRNSSQDGCAFTVTFRQRGRARHARIQHHDHLFSFHWGSYRAPSVRSLLEYHRDPAVCTFFEPTLAVPRVRNFPLSLQELCRATINASTTYEGIGHMPLPRAMMEYLWDHHYKEKAPDMEEDTLLPEVPLS